MRTQTPFCLRFCTSARTWNSPPVRTSGLTNTTLPGNVSRCPWARVTTTSTGRLFDTAAAIAGFTREMSFEGQAAMWLQHLAHECEEAGAHPFPFTGEELDFRPLLATMLRDRLRGRPCAEIARAFHRGVATGISQAVLQLAGTLAIDTVVFSGGVFQNELLLRDIHALLSEARLTVWVNHAVPPNDGGISLGQAALGAFGRFDR